MGVIIGECNNIIINCTHCCIAVGDYNLRSRIRGDYYRGRF